MVAHLSGGVHLHAAEPHPQICEILHYESCGTGIYDLPCDALGIRKLVVEKHRIHRNVHTYSELPSIGYKTLYVFHRITRGMPRPECRSSYVNGIRSAIYRGLARRVIACRSKQFYDISAHRVQK